MSVATKNIKYIAEAPVAWNALNGVVLLYKPAMRHFLQVRQTLIDRLCKDLNSMRVRPPINHVSIEGPTNAEMKVVVHPSYADHPLVVGPRYQPQDFKVAGSNKLETDTCGVLVCGINNGVKLINKIRQSKPTKFYRVKGVLGQATDNYFRTGKIMEKSTYKHVKRPIIDKLCSAMQSSHQRKMFEMCGVDMQSEAAFQLALKGPIRPSNPNIPVIYTIKCIDFTPPEFTLEIVCINEYEMYLKTIIHDLGIQLHTSATCTQIQCFQCGLFNIDHALLQKHWDLEYIINNMQICQKIIDNNKFLIEQDSPILIEAEK